MEIDIDIDVRYHYISEKVDQDIVKISYCPTDEQIADIFTKALERIKFGVHQKKLQTQVQN